MLSVLRVLRDRPRLVCLASLALTGIALASAWLGLGISTDRLELIGDEHAYMRHYKALREAFPDLEAIIVVAGAEDPAHAALALADLGDRLRAEPTHFEGVFHGVSPEAWVGKALLFLELEELERIAGQLEGSGPALSALAERGLGAFCAATAVRIEALLSSPPLESRADLDTPDLAFLHTLAQDCAAAATGRGTYRAPWSDWLLRGERLSGSIVTDDGRVVLLARTRARAGEAREDQIKRLRDRVAEVQQAWPNVSLGVTGNPVLEVDELHTFRRDAWTASLASFLGIALLLMVVQRRFALPLLLTATVALAVLWTLGLAAVWPGRLNLISVAFCVFLVSFGVDYGLHVVLRWWETQELSAGVRNPRAADLTVTTQAIAAGAITTALAFLATLFSDVQGIREFGVLAAVGTLLCLVVSVGVLPALLRFLPPVQPRPRRHPPLARWLDGYVVRAPRSVVAACAVLALLGAWCGATELRYEANLLALQSSDQASARLARDVLSDDAVAGMFAACVVSDRARLEVVERSLADVPEVGRCESILSVLPRQQAEKLEVLQAIGRRVELPMAAATSDTAADALRGLSTLIDVAERATELAVGTPHAGTLNALTELLDDLDRLADALANPQPGRFARYQEALRRDLRASLLRLATECRATPLDIGDLPADIRARFIGPSGKLLLRIYPRDDPWDSRALAAFLHGVESVVADVSGVPVQLHESDHLLRQGTWRAFKLSCALVVFFLLLHFRSLRATLIVLGVLAVGLAWAVGALTLVRSTVGPPHLIALPLVIGIGVDYAIHIVHEHRNRTSRDHQLWSTSTGSALWLSSLTTCFGFAVLGVVSHHPGLSSLAWSCCAGVVGCYLSASLFAPALLRVSGEARVP